MTRSIGLGQNKSPIQSKVIYGDDDRLDIYQVDDQDQLNWASSTVALVQKDRLFDLGDGVTEINTRTYGESYGLCEDELFREQPIAAFCSGFLVSEDLIVTAGHCIIDDSDCSRAAFVFGFDIPRAGQPQLERPNSEIYLCKQIIESRIAGNGADYAVIRLDRPVTGHLPLSVSDNINLQVNAPLIVIGHPAGLPTKVAAGASVRSIEAGYFIANLDTYGGNSGSAVIGVESGQVEGILVRGEVDFVSVGGCRKSKVCSNDGCRGEDVTRSDKWIHLIDN